MTQMFIAVAKGGNDMKPFKLDFILVVIETYFFDHRKSEVHFYTNFKKSFALHFHNVVIPFNMETTTTTTRESTQMSS